MGHAAVQIVWVLTAIWSVHHTPEHHYQQFHSPDNCKTAAIQAVETGGAKFAYCTEGYAAPLQYLPWNR